MPEATEDPKSPKTPRRVTVTDEPKQVRFQGNGEKIKRPFTPAQTTAGPSASTKAAQDNQRQQQQQQQQQQQEKEEQDEKAPEDDTQDGGVSLQTVVESVKPVEEIQPEKPKYPGLSLKALALERLNREIQVKGKGHDSLEDALATRDLLLWHIINKPKPPEAIVAVEQEGW